MNGLAAIKRKQSSLARLMTSPACLVLVCGLLAGCASDRARFGNAARDAMMQPLKDVGLIRPVTPPSLERIIDPYAPPLGPGCNWLGYEIASLDAVLGPDESVRSDGTRPWISMEQVSSAAETAVRGAGTGVMPGRGLVRRVTGAEAADERRNQATDRGKLRRAYLVGISRARDCTSEWAPQLGQ
jgi:hypothetical protein